MGRHRAPRTGRRSVQIRLLLCLGIFALPGGVGTLAYWTDTATITSESFTTGSLDLTVGATADNATQLAGEGGTFEYSQLTIANLVPGESIARPFVVRNSGTVGLTYNATVATSDDELTSAGVGLQLQVFEGATPTADDPNADGIRNGSCQGGSSVMADGPVTTAPRQVHAGPQTLLPSATKTYCAVIKLHANAPNALQGKGTSLIIALDATQLAAP